LARFAINSNFGKYLNFAFPLTGKSCKTWNFSKCPKHFLSPPVSSTLNEKPFSLFFDQPFHFLIISPFLINHFISIIVIDAISLCINNRTFDSINQYCTGLVVGRYSES
jgi:hypothetical protein